MTSILFLTEAIYCNIFRSKYLRKEKYFLIFFCFFFAFSNFTFNFEDFQKRDFQKISLVADVFLNLQTRKKVDR